MTSGKRKTEQDYHNLAAKHDHKWVTALDSLLTPDQKQQTEDIHEELGRRIEEAQKQLDVAVKQLKRTVANQAVTFLAKQHTVSYVSGRVKWDTDILENLMFECPDIVTARKQSRPYTIN